MRPFTIQSAILALLLCSLNLRGQTDEQNTDSLQAEQGKHTNLLAYFYELQQITGVDSIQHNDPMGGYELVIPIWWRIKETPSPYLLGGTFPPIDGIRNALIFKVYDKARFEDVQGFEDWVVNNYKMGDTPEWSDSHKMLLKKKLDNFSELGKSFKVQLIWRGSIYHCFYLIIETSNAFLWVDFTATKETYEINFTKFEQIMSNYKTL